MEQGLHLQTFDLQCSVQQSQAKGLCNTVIHNMLNLERLNKALYFIDTFFNLCCLNVD